MELEEREKAERRRKGKSGSAQKVISTECFCIEVQAVIDLLRKFETIRQNSNIFCLRKNDFKNGTHENSFRHVSLQICLVLMCSFTS